MLKSRDHRAVREVAPLVDTRALQALVAQDPPDLIAERLLGWTYWFTAQASAGEREALRRRAVEAFAITLYAELGEVPEPLVGDIVDQAVHDIESYEVDLLSERLGHQLNATLRLRVAPAHPERVGEELAGHDELAFAGAISGEPM